MARLSWENMIPLWIFGTFGFMVLLDPVIYVHDIMGQRIASAWARFGLN